jgi:hypothetical protein
LVAYTKVWTHLKVSRLFPVADHTPQNFAFRIQQPMSHSLNIL